MNGGIIYWLYCQQHACAAPGWVMWLMGALLIVLLVLLIIAIKNLWDLR